MAIPVRYGIEALANRLLLTDLGLECERLNQLDDLWTGYLADPGDESDLRDNLPALQSLVGEMSLLLSSISLKSRDLRNLVREFPSDLGVELDLLMAQHPESDVARGWLRQESLAGLVVEACAVVERESSEAMAELAGKLRTIAAGEFAPGDLPRKLKCAVAMVGVGALVLSACAAPGALIVLPAAVLAGSGIVGAVGSGLAALRGWDCVGVFGAQGSARPTG